MILQGVPRTCWQLRTKFWKLKNHICLKVSPGMVEFPFWKLKKKIIFNLKILPIWFCWIQVSSKRFLFKNFKTDLTFWYMWFFNFQNLVWSCQHIDGTPCIFISYCTSNSNSCNWLALLRFEIHVHVNLTSNFTFNFLFREVGLFISFVVVLFTYKKFARAENWGKAVFEKFFFFLKLYLVVPKLFDQIWV